MSLPALMIEESRIQLSWGGFTSKVNRHRHYMKHVARLNQAVLHEFEDPERWTDLWPEARPLAKDTASRRSDTAKRLRSTVPRCTLSSEGPCAEDACAGECEPRKVAAVENAFAEDLQVYERLLETSLEKALGEPVGNTRLFFVQKDEAGAYVLKALGSDRVMVVAFVENGRLRVKTGYRRALGCKPTPFARLVFDFNLKRTAARTRGVLARASVAQV